MSSCRPRNFRLFPRFVAYLLLLLAALLPVACSNADYDAGVNLALNHQFTQAYRHFVSSANAGYTPAMLQVGNYLEHGIGIKIDLQLAEDWYRRAYQAGDEHAILVLGKFYLKQQRYTDALEFLRQGLHTRDGETVYLLARSFENGWGTEKDRASAIKYYTLAANLNYSNADRQLHRLGVDTRDTTGGLGLPIYTLYLLEYPATWFVFLFLNLLLLPIYARAFFDDMQDFGDHLKQLFQRPSHEERVELAAEGEEEPDNFLDKLKTLSWFVFYLAVVTTQYKLFTVIFY